MQRAFQSCIIDMIDYRSFHLSFSSAAEVSVGMEVATAVVTARNIDVVESEIFT